MMGPYCDAARPSDQARNVCGPHLFIPIALLLLTTGASLTADADGIGPDNSSDTTGLAEIVVTARLRSENLMSVPDTVKAFSPEEITERQLTQLSDFLTLTPNAKIIVEQDVAQSEIYIRGVGSNKSQLPAVAFVIDGVILPDNDAFTMDLSDANQVEILKGPQGALYGKGALAGVINITTRQPSNTPSGDLKIDFGSNNTYGVFADLDGPIIPDTLLGGVQVRYHSTDGPFENHYNGSGFEFDRDEKISGKLIATPTDILRLELDLSYYQQYAGLPPYVGVNVLGMNSTNITSAEAATPVDQDCSMSCTTHRVVDMGAFTVAWDTPAGKLSSITAYDQIDLHFYQDVDFTSLNLVDSFGERDTRSFSQEFRLASTAPGARLRYNFSTYFQHEDYYFDSQGWFDFCFFGVISCATPPHVPSGILVPLHLNQFETKTDAYAIAGQLSYDITPQMEATVALRYDDDRPHEQDFLNDVSPSTSYSEWQPKFSLAYKPTSDLTGYATYSRGFKPGVFNPPQPAGSPFPTVIKKEVTDNLEVGVKTSSFERRLIITAAAFYTDYTDPQEFHVDIQSGGNEAVNVDKAHIVGFETDMAARPVANIDLNAAFGYTKSNIVSFNGTSEYVGQSLPYQPRYTANLGAQYTAHLGSTDMKMRADWKWDGKTSFQDFQDPNPNQFLTQAHDDTLDLSVTFLRGAWAFNLYGKNVLNERYVVSAYSRYISCLLFCAGALNQDVLLPAPGVTWGGQLRYAF